jgi:hypothetical protein
MGRPPKKDEKKVPVTISVDPAVYKQITKMSENSGQTTANLITNLMMVGLDLAKVYDVFGVFSAVGIGRKLVKSFKTWKEQGEIVLSQDGEFKIVNKK